MKGEFYTFISPDAHASGAKQIYQLTSINGRPGRTANMQEPIKKVRVACYVRHSDPIHIEDQILQCKKVADENGWVLDDHIYIDDQPGAATHREGLEALLAEIKNPDREFDGVVIEETSRLARSLTDLLRICRILTYYGGFMFFAVQLLDSRDPMFSELMYMGTQDEVYLARRQAVAVRRGQVGRIKKGLIGNGGCFGYDHEIGRAHV